MPLASSPAWAYIAAGESWSMKTSGSIIERIAPRSFLRALIHDAERRPINASGAHRHPTRRQKRVVKERDGACVDCVDPTICALRPVLQEARDAVAHVLDGRSLAQLVRARPARPSARSATV